MKITTRITTEEYESFLKWAQKRGKRWKFYKVFWTMIAVVTVLTMFAEVKSFNFEGLAVLCIFVCVTIIPYLIPKYAARHFLKHPFLKISRDARRSSSNFTTRCWNWWSGWRKTSLKGTRSLSK